MTLTPFYQENLKRELYVLDDRSTQSTNMHRLDLAQHG